MIRIPRKKSLKPSEFAKAFFGWEAFDYQEKPLNDEYRRVLMACVAEGTEVLCEDGLKKIEDVKEDDLVYSMTDYKHISPRPVSNIIYQGRKKVYKIRTVEGSEIEITPDHRIYSRFSGKFDKVRSGRKKKEGWFSIDDGLNSKNQVAVPYYFSLPKRGNRFPKHYAKLFGYMFSDGSWTQTPKFTNNNKDYIEEVRYVAVEYLGAKPKLYKKGDKGHDLILGYANNFKEILDHCFKNIHTINMDRALFLNRLFAGDGWISTWKRKRENGTNSHITIGLIHKDKEFLKKIKLILNSHGIGCYITETKGENKQKQPYFKLRISRSKSICNFFEYIGLIYGKEVQSYRCWEEAKKIKSDRENDGEIFWEQIKSIIYVGEKDVYDLEVDGNHNFIAGNIIVHNCGRQVGKTEMAALRALHAAIMNPDSTILILAPVQRQAQILFRRIKYFINKNAQLPEDRRIPIEKLIERETQTVIEFKNGSALYCLPISEDGANIRGFTAHSVIIDEAEMVKDEAWAAINPMLATTKGTLWLIGTPYGQNNMFYRWFRQAERYTEMNMWDENRHFSIYRFPSRISPLIDDDYLLQESERLPHMEYSQEYEAIFLETVGTLWSERLVNSVMKEECPQRDGPVKNYKYYLGYDVARFGDDEAVGIILEKRIHKDKDDTYFVVKTFEMKGKSLDYQVKYIQSLHKIWNFEKIIVDVTGTGGGVVDPLIAKSYPVEGFNFTTKAKQDAYFNTTRLLESGNLILPIHRKLKKQMVEMKREEQTGTGFTKIYHPQKTGGDDYCAALVLACWAVKSKQLNIYFDRSDNPFF